MRSIYKAPFFHFILVFMFSVFLAGCGNDPEDLNNSLAPYGIRFTGTGPLKLVRDFSQPAKGMMFRKIIASSDKLRIEVEMIQKITEPDAVDHLTSKYEIIKNLYGHQVIPYPAAITRSTGAPEDKKPVETSVAILGDTVPLLLANASDRYVLGVWDDEIIAQRAGFAGFYDRDLAVLYMVTVFMPMEDYSPRKMKRVFAEIRRVRVRPEN